jgi:hypothetical protein
LGRFAEHRGDGADEIAAMAMAPEVVIAAAVPGLEDGRRKGPNDRRGGARGERGRSYGRDGRQDEQRPQTQHHATPRFRPPTKINPFLIRGEVGGNFISVTRPSIPFIRPTTGRASSCAAGRVAAREMTPKPLKTPAR